MDGENNRSIKAFYISVACLFLLVLLSYWPSFTVPFYLDDQDSIVNNPILLTNDISLLLQHYGMRFIGYLSFWINHQWFDASLLSYHLVNFSIHLSNGVLIYYIVKQLAIHYGHISTEHATRLALIVTTIWLVHPLNTQAVTYVVQRLASLSTTFVLVTLLSYLVLRLKGFSWRWCGVLILSIGLGALTKQSYFVIFLFVILFELFVDRRHRQNLAILLMLVCFTMALILPYFPELSAQISAFSKETQAISRIDYFNTQLTVLWVYMGKLFLPINLQLDMGIELVKGSTGLQFFAFLCHCLLIVIALRARKVVPLFTIGILWFYAGHSVESFLIPITDLAFEHRTYFPNIGLILAVVALVNDRLKLASGNFLLLVAGVILCLSALTFYRNTQWQKPFEFYQNELALAPDSARSKESFAVQLIARGKLQQGQNLLLAAVNQNFKENKATLSSLNNLMKVLFQQGHYQTGVQTAMKALKYVRNTKERSQMLTTIAFGYVKMGHCGFATGLAKKAVKLDNTNSQAKEYIEFCQTKN